MHFLGFPRILEVFLRFFARFEAKETFSKPAPLETTLGEKWHAFYDLRGVKYYYNFETQELLKATFQAILGLIKMF